MKIEWNRVTWYSKLLAVLLFVATFALGFTLGSMNAVKVYVNVPFPVHHQTEVGNSPTEIERI
jgi:hypothetical protein